MNNVLMLGNGISMLCGGDSTNKLIEDMMKRYGTADQWNIIKELPFNYQVVAVTKDHVDLEVSRICDTYCSEEISSENAAIIREIVNDFDDILTTNYSFEIEQAFGARPSAQSYRKLSVQTKSDLKDRQKRTNVYKYHQAGGKRVWHIHGDAAAPRSAILGHYYYGMIQYHIHDRIKAFMRISKSAGATDNTSNPESWIDLFLAGNVFVLGTTLDVFENDLFYLLSCKKRNFPDSKVFFFFFLLDPPQPKRDILLEAYNVNIIRIDTVDYTAFYKDATARIHDIVRQLEDSHQRQST